MHDSGSIRLAHVANLGKPGEDTLSDRARGVSRTGMDDLPNRLIDDHYVIVDVHEIDRDRWVRGERLVRIEYRIIDDELLSRRHPSGRL